MLSQEYATVLVNSGIIAGLLGIPLVLLLACCFKKSRSILDKPFALYTFSLLCMLLTGILAWLYGPVDYGVNCYKVVLTVDFFVVYLSCIFFYWYLKTLVYSALHPEATEPEPLSLKFKLFAAFCSFLTTGVFASSFWTGWAFSFNEQGLIAYHTPYLICQILSGVWHVATALYLYKNRKLMGRFRKNLLMLYVLLPVILFWTDAYLHMVLGYVAISTGLLILYVNINISNEQQLLKYQAKLAKQEMEMTETKMELMMMQIQPHFLYNALSTISWLCTHNPGDARVAVNEFASYLRKNMESINTKAPIPFYAELDHVNNYLNIEKRRFPTRLIVEYDIGPSNFMIPTLTLQTLVENAVRHGVGARFEPTTVTIRTLETDEYFLVKVVDDGPGFDIAQIPDDNRQHIGLAGARYRIEEMMNGHVLIESEIGKGTEITIQIPKEAV